MHPHSHDECTRSEEAEAVNPPAAAEQEPSGTVPEVTWPSIPAQERSGDHALSGGADAQPDASVPRKSANILFRHAHSAKMTGEHDPLAMEVSKTLGRVCVRSELTRAHQNVPPRCGGGGPITWTSSEPSCVLAADAFASTDPRLWLPTLTRQ